MSERDELRAWVARSLPKPGIWGSGLDTLLARLRTAIDENPGARFPVEAIERELTSLSKSLTFQDAELDDVLALRYSGPRRGVSRGRENIAPGLRVPLAYP